MFGVIGLGQMGGSIAKRLLEVGQETMVCDLSAEAVKATGAKLVAKSPAEIGEKCDLVLVVVRDDDEVREVVLGKKGVLEGALKKSAKLRKEGVANPTEAGSDADNPAKANPTEAGSANPAEKRATHWHDSKYIAPLLDRPVVLIHSTVHPETVLEIAVICIQQGLWVLDAPVTGGPSAATKGDLAIMLGGEESVCADVAPELAHYGGKVLRMGGVGAGQKAKIARNLITYSEWAVAAEATALAEAAGVDADQLWEIIDHSDKHISAHAGYSALRQALLGEEMRPIAGLAKKDLALAEELSKKVKRDPWLAKQVSNGIDDSLGL